MNFVDLTVAHASKSDPMKKGWDKKKDWGQGASVGSIPFSGLIITPLWDTVWPESTSNNLLTNPF